MTTLALLPAESGAQSLPPSGAASVQIAISGQPGDVSQVEQVLGDLLVPLPLVARFLRVSRVDVNDVLALAAPQEGLLAQVWIELRSEARCTVYLVDVARERVLIRRVTATGGIDGVVVEELGQIISSSLEALLAGRIVGVTRQEAAAELEEAGSLVPLVDTDQEQPPSTPLDEPPCPDLPPTLDPPSPPTPPRRPLALGLTLGYALDVWSFAEPPLHGPMAAIDIALVAVPLEPTIGLVFRARMPTDIEASAAGARVDSNAFRLRAALRLVHVGRFALRLAATFGADVVRVDPTLGPEGEDLTAAARQTFPVLVLGAGIDMRLRLVGSLCLSFRGGVDFSLSDTTYVVRYNERTAVVFDPFWALPSFALVLTGQVF